jgi:hypothetical protein
MSDQYRLVGLGNSELLAGLSELTRQGNALTAHLLAHLVELEERMLHLELGFSSLFAYCVEALGMSEGTAGRRVTAVRVCRRFPEVFDRLARGELHLCALCAIAPHLNCENAAQLFEACRRKTRRQVEELLAVRFPRPDVREQIRRLPVRKQVAAVPSEVQLPPSRASEASLSPPAPPEMPKSPMNSGPAASAVSDARRRVRELEPLSADRFGVHFTADAELRNLIERARALASHRLPNGDLAGLIKLMTACFVRQEEKRRFGVGAHPRRLEAKTEPPNSTGKGAPPGGVGKRARYVPVTVRRETHTRDGGQCSFVSADGRRCSARALLELDHRNPFARHGASDALNIRLLCRAHNLLHARHCLGTLHVAAKIAARKRCPSTIIEAG